MPREFRSEKYVATVSDDGLITVRNGPKVLRETKFTPDGGVDVTLKTAENSTGADLKLLRALDRMPVFQATWAGNRQWNVDIDCGFQRFNGTKPHGQLVKALENCGFDQEQIKEIVVLGKKAKKQDYCPRQW
jgi:hypothetical protein